MDSGDCAAAFVVKPPAVLGLYSVGCNVCFDYGSSFLCSEYTRYFGVETSVSSASFGYGQRTNCVLALTLAVRGSNYVVLHRPPLSAVCLRSLRLPALLLRLRTEVNAVCN